MTDTPDKLPALEATDYRYDDWYEGRLIAYGYEPSRNRRRNVLSRTVETPLTDLNRANEIIAENDAEIARLRVALEDAKQSLALAIYGLPEMLENNALSDEEGMVPALQAAVERMEAALKGDGQ